MLLNICCISHSSSLHLWLMPSNFLIVKYSENIKPERMDILYVVFCLLLWCNVFVVLKLKPRQSIYSESVWLALVVFGVPSLVISIICYALCCMETVEEDETYDELDPDDDEQDGRCYMCIVLCQRHIATQPVMSLFLKVRISNLPLFVPRGQFLKKLLSNFLFLWLELRNSLITIFNIKYIHNNNYLNKDFTINVH
jgi:hypothetical protein